MRTRRLKQRSHWRRAELVLVFGVFAAASCGPAPALIVDVEAPAATSEAGGSAAVSVVLGERPDALVTVRARSSDESEGRVSGTLRFTPSDWDRPQLITVTGVDDALDDGDQPYEVTLEASVADDLPFTTREVIERVAFINRDDDTTAFTGLGDLAGGATASHATGASAAGDVVVGYSRSERGDEAVRWTLSEGLVSLGGDDSRAQAVSPDGTLIVGSQAEASAELGRIAVSWRGSQPLEPLPSIVVDGDVRLFEMVEAAAVIEDGRVFGSCVQYRAYGTHLGCYTDQNGELQILAGPADLFTGDASGSYAGASYPDPRGGGFGSVAMFNGLTLGYPSDAACIVPHACRSEVRAFSADRALLVGTALLPAPSEPPLGPDAESPLFETAIAYSEVDGMQRFPDLPEGETASGAYAITPDGRLIGGFGADARGRAAVVWIDREARALDALFKAVGGQLPSGWVLLDVTSISSDGKVFAGNGQNPEGYPEAYRLEFDALAASEL